ncbi:MAG: hypothetical protein ABSC23_13875 [Bryobacteraceae bacterium]|jgi:hypothetical protein
MTITFLDGRTVDAVILARTEATLRVALKGSEDVLELSNVHGTWVSEDCEPVRIGFAWQTRSRVEPPSEADCICPRNLAARLVRSLLEGGNEPEWKADFRLQPSGDASPMYVC